MAGEGGPFRGACNTVNSADCLQIRASDPASSGGIVLSLFLAVDGQLIVGRQTLSELNRCDGIGFQVVRLRPRKFVCECM